jgi:predicted acetyltransferase
MSYYNTTKQSNFHEIIKICQKHHQIFNWQTQAKQYPENGNGIEYFKGVMKNDKWVDCLLYYGNDSKLKGVLNFYPFDLPPYEIRGNVNLEVKQSERRKGIATALLDEGIKRFQIDLRKQVYTELGRKFIKKYNQHKKYRVS